MDEFVNIISNTNRIPVFLDLNNMLYRSYFVFPPDKFKSPSGLPSGHLFGLCQILRTLDKLNYEVFICEDSKCEWRKNLNENYKAQRSANGSSIDFWKCFNDIRALISDLPHFHTLYSEGYEADDIMFSGAKICSQHNIKCYIFSTDKDLMQALDNNISILHKVTLKENEEIHYNSDYYNDKFPIEPNKLPYYRAFKGDASDNLQPPVKRLPKDLILDLVDYLYDNKSLKGYTIKKKSHEKWLKQLAENWSAFQNNYLVMKLNIINFNIAEKLEKGSYKKVCQDYGLFQFYKYINEEINA